VEDSVEDEAKVDKSMKRKTNKYAIWRTKRKFISHQRTVAVGLSKRKKVLIEARKSTTGNTHATAKVAK